MFAYCGNNPIVNYDPSGYLYQDFDPTLVGALGYAAAGIAITVAVDASNKATVTDTPDIFAQAATELRELTAEVYAYSQMLRQKLAQWKKRQPQVHHIVPKFQFSGRSDTTQKLIAEMHKKLENAGINRFIDPMNLMLVSSGTHATLHTDAYIAHVHSYVMAADNSKEGIYGALHALRIEIAADDKFSIGY